jgi:transketolase
MGSVAADVARAADELARQGIRCGILVVSRPSPAPAEALGAALARYREVATVEAHYAVGGVGSLVAEVATELGLGCRVTRCGVRGLLEGRSGSTGYMHEAHGIGPRSLVRTVQRLVGARTAAASS